MPRRILHVSALLVVLVACRDGPTQVAAPVQALTAPQPDVTVSVDALRTVTERLNDPFVRELMDGVGAYTESLHRAVRDASIYRTQDQVLTLSRVLTATKSELFAIRDNAEEDPDEEVLRAALVLVLDDAATLLERPSPREERERDVVLH